MTIVIIGGNGQLGHDLQKVFLQETSFKVIPLDHKEIEVTDFRSIEQKLGKLKFDVVINTAAYHRVDDIEKDSKKAFDVNVKGAKNVAQFCATKNSKVVFLSTDYVFGANEKRKSPYGEDDLTGPINTYGITKLAGEYMTQSFSKDYLIIRSTGLFGSAGSSGKGGNFVETMLRLAREKGTVSVVGDQQVCPTYTLNLAQQIAVLLKKDAKGTYHAVSESSCSWYDFAKEIFRLTGQSVKMKKITSSQSETLANRPKYSVLSNKRLKKMKINVMRSWQKNLNLYLMEKGYL